MHINAVNIKFTPHPFPRKRLHSAREYAILSAGDSFLQKAGRHMMKQQAQRMITTKDTVGYALGDAGGQLIFGLLGVFLTMFYTDVLGITPTQVAVLMLFTRIWDGVNDPIWGAVVDRLKPGRHGRFRPWLLWGSFPLAASALIMFSNPGLGRWNVLWAYFGYIVYDMSYTMVNVSYGSLASVISPLERDRSTLSIARSAGSGVGALPAAILLPLFVFGKNADGSSFLDSKKLLASVAVLAGLSVAVLAASFLLTKERVAPEQARKPELRKTFRALLRNRPFLMLCLTTMLMIAVQMYTAPMNSYLFKDYFRQPNMITLYSVFTYAPMALLLPVLGSLAARFGKKELCAAGLLFGTLAYTLAYFARTQNAYVYLGFCLLSGLGMTFLVMEVWALVTDVIDYQGLLSGQREEGTAYALFSFTRKLGHTAAGSGSALLLGYIGYDGALSAQSARTVSGMYTAATLVPAVALALMFLVLTFGYPLGKAKLREMHAQMAAKGEEAGKVKIMVD